jgi:predicted nucleic-acid-binding protein
VIGLDTNVLVRYLVRDDPAQTRIADRIIEGAEDAGEPVFVNHVVLSELVWILARSYRFNRTRIAEVLEGMLSAPTLAFEGKDCALGALRDFQDGTADYSDCLIGRKNRAAGCETTVTFDAEAVKMPGFRSA